MNLSMKQKQTRGYREQTSDYQKGGEGVGERKE